MRKMTTLIACLILLTSVGCNGEKCTNENIEILGGWEVTEVEFVDEKGLMKEFVESQGKDFDEFIQKMKIFEQVEYHFKEN